MASMPWAHGSGVAPSVKEEDDRKGAGLGQVILRPWARGKALCFLFSFYFSASRLT